MAEVANQAGLTPRETEVLRLDAASGLGHLEIAEQLGISVKTVQVHLRNAREKIPLEVNRQSDLEPEVARASSEREAAGAKA